MQRLHLALPDRKNAWIRECKRRSRYDRLGLEGIEARAAKGTPEEIYVKKEEYRRIREAIRNLEEPYREVFVMHLFGGVSLKEIVAANGRAESWGRVTFLRAKKKIAESVMDMK